MVDAARPSCRAIARKLSPSPLSAASRSLSSSLRCVPPDIAPSRFAIPARALPQGPGMLRFTPDSAQADLYVIIEVNYHTRSGSEMKRNFRLQSFGKDQQVSFEEINDEEAHL